MEYDIESILEMYEDDYTPEPRPMAQEPRNMYNQGQLVSNTVDGSRPGYAGVKGQDRGAVQNLYDQFGKNVINKLSREKFGKNFDKVEGGKGAHARNNFVRRIKKKGPLNIEEMQLAGRDLQVKNRLGIQLDILEDLKKGPVTVEALAKKYKVSQKVIKENGTKLLKNIYNKNVQMGKGVERGGRFLPNDDVAIDKILNNISKSPKLAVIQKDQIGRLFYDAFGREKLSNGKKNPTYNSKKYTAILKNLNEYNNIKKIISDKYPNIKLELDHPLPKSTLRKIFNASVDELVAVNPLERSLNQGFKKSLSDSYEKAITGEGNLKQKKAIQKIAKDLNINIGNVSNNFSKYNKGVKSFEKLNIKDEVLKSMQTQADLNSNLKGYVKQNPDLFKTANVNPNSKITKVTQGQVKQIASLLEKLGCGKSAGGRIKFNKGTTCAIKGRDILEKGLANGFKKSDVGLAQKILGTSKFLKDAVSLRGLFGPAALAFTAAAEAGIVGYDMLTSGKSFKEAVGSSVFNYMLGDKTKINEVEERDKRMVAEGMTPEQMGKIKYMESMMGDMQQGFDLDKQLNAITKNKKQIGNNPEDTFNEGAFQLDLDKQENKVRADIQDYHRVNKVGELENYFLPKEDGTVPFFQGMETLGEGLRRNELAQLQSVNNPLQSRKGDEKRSARKRELMLQNPDVRNYMGSYPTNYGFNEGGLAGLMKKKYD